MTGPEHKDTTMTDTNTIRLKAIAAILEAVDQDDAKDAATAVAMIRTMLGAGAEKAEK